jgi:hypothetical protein
LAGHHNHPVGVHHIGLVEELHIGLVEERRIGLVAGRRIGLVEERRIGLVVVRHIGPVVVRHIVLEGVLEAHRIDRAVVADTVQGEEHNHVVGVERHIDLGVGRTDLEEARHTGLGAAAGHSLAEDNRRTVDSA